MNTHFEKHVSKYSTWFHPRYKRHYQIDYILTGRPSFRHFLDVYIGGNLADSDHSAVFAKIRIATIRKRPRPPQTSAQKLRQLDFTPLESDAFASEFCQDVIRNFNNCDLLHPYKKLESALHLSLISKLVKRRRFHKNWFNDAAHILEPLISKRNRILSNLRKNRTLHVQQQLRAVRSQISRSTKTAINSWIQKHASIINNNSKFKGVNKSGWDALKELKRGHSNVKLVKNVKVRKPNGELCVTAAENADTCKNHFAKLFQINPTVDLAVLLLLPQLPAVLNADRLPSDQEITAAIAKLNPTSPGLSGVPSIAWKCLATNQLTFEMIRIFLHDFWTSESPPQDWNEGKLKILPKKGNLQDLNNYRGIILLESAYKIAANIIRARLMPIMDSLEHESQCGFRPGRACIDAVLSLKLALKKRQEHGLQTWILFLDLVKAFDRVPRNMLWEVLAKFGVPQKLIRLLISLHTNIHISLDIFGFSKSFFNTTGVKQGDVLGPVLFNFYIAALLITWRSSTTTNECVFKTTQDVKLTGRKFNTHGELVVFRDSAYADDTAVLFSTRRDAIIGTNELIAHFARFGMLIHVGTDQKASKSEMLATKLSVSNAPPTDASNIPCENDTFIPVTSRFSYLGSIINDDLYDSMDVITRISKANNAYGSLREAIFSNRHVSLHSKSAIYQSVILPVLLYGAEHWCLNANDIQKLQTFHHNSIRRICKITRRQQRHRHVHLNDLRTKTHIPTIQTLLTRKTLQWSGHVVRMPWRRLPRKMLSAWVENPRRRGAPIKSYGRTINIALNKAGIDRNDWALLAADRLSWKALLRAISC